MSRSISWLQVRRSWHRFSRWTQVALLAVVLLLLTALCWYSVFPKRTDHRQVIDVDSRDLSDRKEKPAPSAATAAATGAPKLILVTGYQRSGTSFIGELIKQSRGTFYVFEPLRTVIGGPNDHPDESIQLISSLIMRFADCSFTSLSRFQQFLKQHPTFMFQPRYPRNASRETRLRLQLAFVRQLCLRSKRRALKSFYVPMHRLESFMATLELETRQGLAIVYLVRDPRAIINSRRDRDWCDHRCRDPDLLCSDMSRDLAAFARLKPGMGDRLTMLRFEDFALNPDEAARQLYSQLQLAYTEEIRAYVQRHTRVPGKDSTLIRDSRKQVTRWLHELPPAEVARVQEACVSPMHLLGYSNVSHPVGEREESLLVGPHRLPSLAHSRIKLGK